MEVIGLSRPQPIEQVVAHRYRLLESLGPCGEGERFVAEDDASDQRVLLLLLPTEYRKRLRPGWERRLDLDCGDPRILRPLDAGVDERGQPYLVHRWVTGEPLTTWRARLTEDGVPPWSETVELLEELADMLGPAHERRLIHGSLEPSRIFVGRGGPWLLDFGLSHALGRTTISPAYAAPEVLRGRAPSTLADLYGLGVVIWELVSGAPPFSGSFAEVAAAHRDGLLPELVRRGGAPVELDALLSIALARLPDERFSDAHELLETLRGIQASSSGVWSLSSFSTQAGTLAPTTELGAMLRTFSVIELRATRALIDELLAARGE
ncbi:serine/threonine protein kinase [Pseudenhygromyxa sp. WMMC2535]|nr:serine/threonine protein kinase [Pseudenhygromyxa sp. WMMC2535]